MGNSRSIFDLPQKEKDLAQIEAQMAKDDFWLDQDKAREVGKERTALSSVVDSWKTLSTDVDEAELLLDMALEEEDEESMAEVQTQITQVSARFDKMSLDRMLSGEDDNKGAIVAINAGAGGTDAQDWAEILMRMYLRWAEDKGFTTQILDYQPGDEAGVKSITFTAEGAYAYGYFKLEEGIHRLVRISPFNASGKRHTSFASVSVYPQLDKEIQVDVEEKDLRVDTFRASGAGGQHVNKTCSAIRIMHIPTGIVVQCQQEKSQHRNRDLAMKVLKARLYQQEKDKQQKKMQDLYESKEEIGWGNQIRSYVLHPYQMVKDHRIKLDVGNVQSVLDGNLDPFMEAVLLSGRR